MAVGALSDDLKAALIGGSVTIVVFLLGGLVAWLRQRSDRVESSRAIYRKYSDPITSAATGLLWRLNEVFDGSGAGYYLVGHQHPAAFEHYKAVSTLYRIGAMLGWVRALRRELFFVASGDPGRQRALESALGRFQSVLADGSHMELARVDSILSLIFPDHRSEVRARQEVGTRLDYELDRTLHELGAESLADLSEDDAKRTVTMAVQVVAGGLSLGSAPQLRVDEHWRTCLGRLAVREAWIYRDWQAAIGDLMIRGSTSGDREFEVIGFREFEEMCEHGSVEERKWLSRLNTVLDELDVSASPGNDARIKQVECLYSACGQILVALHEWDARRSNVDTGTLAIATAASRRSPK